MYILVEYTGPVDITNIRLYWININYFDFIFVVFVRYGSKIARL